MTEPAIDVATFEHLLEITGGDLEFVNELVDTYLADGTAQVAALQAALAAADTEALVRPAHTLKSSSANVGALALAEACRTLDAEARTGTVADPASRVATIDAAFTGASQALLEMRIGRG